MTQLERLQSFGPDWGAFGALRRELDELFDRFGSVPARAVYSAYPAVNLYETDEAYVLTAELPGLAPEDLAISLEGSTVTLSGERKGAVEEGASVHRRERPTGAFRRAFDLPVPIDADRVEAVHRNGVLTLRLPKAPEHRPRQISVKAG
jgi:HSP20 family protein